MMSVCLQVVGELRTLHPERSVELQSPASLRAVFDEGRIAQMLSNLIGNALQYSDEDSPVKVAVANTEEQMIIAVHNRGTPIPSDKIARIFDPLVRVACPESSVDTESTSLGLGLYIAREIAHAHGGHVNVVSNAVDGTTFKVTLPRQAKSRSD
jgi:signal transduction histidine kinase